MKSLLFTQTFTELLHVPSTGRYSREQQMRSLLSLLELRFYLERRRANTEHMYEIISVRMKAPQKSNKTK